MRRHAFCARHVCIVSNCFFLSLYYHLLHITIQININNRIFIKWPTVHIKLMHRHAFNCVRGNQPVLWISTFYLTLTFIWSLHFQHIFNIIFISRHTAYVSFCFVARTCFETFRGDWLAFLFFFIIVLLSLEAYNYFVPAFSAHFKSIWCQVGRKLKSTV